MKHTGRCQTGFDALDYARQLGEVRAGLVPGRKPHEGRHVDLGDTGPLSQEVPAGRQALRIRCINGMEVHKKRPRGFK